MNNLRLLLCLLIINSHAFTQTNQNIKEWQEKNPTILLIEKNDASNELIERFNSLGIEYLIFENEIKESDILSFASNNSLKSSHYQIDGHNVRIDEAQFIKDWLAIHPDIKIITGTSLIALSDEKIEFYKSIDALFLQGETITTQDLKNYDNEH